jgi:hypothetical protein
MAIYPVTIGNSQSGVAIGYGACVPSPNHILTIQYFGSGLTGPCCLYKVYPDPFIPSAQIEVVDCANNILFATGGAALINPDATCTCYVAAEETTWGKMKAIFAE